MTALGTRAGQDAILQATRDIHQRCDVEFNLLWDDGKSHGDGGVHKLKVWNGLGSLYRLVSDHALLERGAAYRRFLDELTEAVDRSLSVR